jgi:hypothetical protein
LCSLAKYIDALAMELKAFIHRKKEIVPLEALVLEKINI